MKKAIFAGVLLAMVSAPAFAQQSDNAAAAAQNAPRAASSAITAAQASEHNGHVLMTAQGRRIGRIVRINDDGGAIVIYNSRTVTIPANTLSVADGQLVTSLTRAQVNDLR